EIFSDQKRAAKAFTDLARSAAGFHVAPRTRQIFGKLRPVLIGWLAKAADPDATLNQFVRFVEAYGLRSLFFELLVANPRLLELLVKTLDASRFATELSDMAEACLLFTARLLGNEQLTIIALGKFGGRELTYGADLDVLFVGDDNRAAQNLIIAMAQSTTEGNIWAVDARLRPEGEKGPLVCSVDTYESYYAGRAQ